MMVTFSKKKYMMVKSIMCHHSTRSFTRRRRYYDNWSGKFKENYSREKSLQGHLIQWSIHYDKWNYYIRKNLFLHSTTYRPTLKKKKKPFTTLEYLESLTIWIASMNDATMITNLQLPLRTSWRFLHSNNNNNLYSMSSITVLDHSLDFRSYGMNNVCLNLSL